LLKGLEVSEVSFSKVKEIVDFRIDSNSYLKEYLFYDDLLKAKNCKPLIDFAKSIQNFGAYSLCNFINFVPRGIPYLMVQSIGENIIDWDSVKYIDESSHKLLHKSHCNKNQVLMAMAGSLGNAAVYTEDFVCSSNQAIAKITLNENLNPYFFSTFLLSKYGNYQIHKLKTVTAQPNINMSLIGKIEIPFITDSFQQHIESLVKSAHAKLSEAKLLYAQAEDTLLSELGLKDWQPKNEAVSIKTFSDFASSGRLDAEYYQSKYDELFEKLSKFDYKRLGDIVSVKKSVEPGSESYIDNGIPFIRVSDVTQFGIAETDLHLSAKEFSLESLRPHKDTILFSKDGSIGIAYKCEQDLDIITSGALLHLDVKDSVLPDYLTLILNSIIVQLQAERDSNGAIIQHWKPDDIKRVIIPILPQETQKKIAELIQQSFALKAESKRLLEDAKLMVEQEIEK